MPSTGTSTASGLSPRSAPGIRARNRAAIDAEVIATAREHLAVTGAAALSLRAVARDLGLVPSALYRYVANRDELLTRLIEVSYTELADAVDAALAVCQASDPRTRFAVVIQALRVWAVTHPHDFALLYGSPVPDYHAPAERTTGPGTRVQARLAELLPTRTRASKRLRRLARRGVGPLAGDAFFAGIGHDPVAAARGLAAWHLVLGAVTAEVFGQLGPDGIPDPQGYLETMIELAVSLVFTDDEAASSASSSS